MMGLGVAKFGSRAEARREGAEHGRRGRPPPRSARLRPRPPPRCWLFAVLSGDRSTAPRARVSCAVLYKHQLKVFESTFRNISFCQTTKPLHVVNLKFRLRARGEPSPQAIHPGAPGPFRGLAGQRVEFHSTLGCCRVGAHRRRERGEEDFWMRGGGTEREAEEVAVYQGSASQW